MPVLHLGVIQEPYVNRGGITTVDVAQILEDEYHVMEVFAEDIGMDAIARALEKSAVEAIEKIVIGSTASVSLSNAGEAEIESAFRHFLSQQEMDNVVAGVPTQASLDGINHRAAKPSAKGNPSRPSFIDTGTFENAFRAWVE